MTARASKRKGERPPLLNNAPPRLVCEQGKPNAQAGETLLRLLTDPRMKGPWATLARQVTDDRGWFRIWQEIKYALLKFRNAKRTAHRPRTYVRDQYASIAKKITSLGKTIENGNLDVRLDVRLYDVLPEDMLSILGLPPKFKELDDFERDTVADKLLPEWPTVSEVLQELAKLAQAEAAAAMTKPRPTERGGSSSGTGRDSAPERVFVWQLGRALKKKFGRSMYGTTATIANVVLECPADDELSASHVRAVLRRRGL